jgi:hypothetical protein
MTDLLQRLRAVNPVPTCAPPTIENVWRWLEREDQVSGPGIPRAGAPDSTRERPGTAARSRLRFSVGRVGLGMAAAVPVLIAAVAIALLSHHRGHHPVATVSPSQTLPGPSRTVPGPSQRLAGGTISCFFTTDGHAHGGGPDVAGVGADGRTPIAICREWYRLNAHTGRNAADVAFVACQQNATTVAVYVADGRSHQCQRLGDRSLPQTYAAAVARLRALVQAFAVDQRRHDCVSVTVLAGEVRATLARLGFVGWRLSLPSTRFDPRGDPPRGTGGTCGHVVGNPAEFDARHRTVFITSGAPTSIARLVNHDSYELYTRTYQQCFTATSVRALVRHTLAATTLRPRFATVAAPAGEQFEPHSQQLYDAGCVRFAFAIPADNDRTIDVLLYARGAQRLSQRRLYPPAEDFRP